MKNKFIYIILTILLFSFGLQAKQLNVFTCEPEWASLAKEIGGDLINVKSAISSRQDPHKIKAKPSIISNMRKANVAICTGADLEIGWLPLVLKKSSNNNVKVIYASSYINLLEKNKVADRKEGDVHPLGNPHLHLDPHNIIKMSIAIRDLLSEADSTNSKIYQDNWTIFNVKWLSAMKRWNQEKASFKGVEVISHHSDWLYLTKYLDLNLVATLEEKSGIDPSASYLNKLLKVSKQENIKLIIRTPWNNSSPSDWLSKKAHIKAIVLPYTVDENESLITLYDTIIARIKEGIRESNN